jgi:outer membrane protein assembly factor BamB/lysophospholipase L1-like esterase
MKLAALLLVSFAPVAAQQPTAPAVTWHNLSKFAVEGKGWSKTKHPYDRLPAHAEGVVRAPVWSLGQDSAGLRYRFVTDARSIHARWKVRRSRLALPHMAATGVSGLDLYVRDRDNWHWLGVGRPEKPDVNESVLVSGLKPARREYMLYLPLYNGVDSVEIGVPADAAFEAAPDRYASLKPVVFYGTSILQGGCASRPGMAYPSIIGRTLDYPTVNLGFSGNGKTEPEVAKLLAELDPAVYVLDSLPNLDVAEVGARVEPFVKTLRAAHPVTPLVLVENVTYTNASFVDARQAKVTEANELLRKLYEKLKAGGDKNIYYVPSAKLFGKDGEDTVDGTHPTDLGFLRMAEGITPSVREALAVRAAGWLRLRGPNGSGVSENGPLPGEISPGKNVVWKTGVPMGKSSPVITVDRIYLTGHRDGTLLTLAIDRRTGEAMWTREAPGHRPEKRNVLNDPAAPTPVSDGSNVYVFFAGYGLISYDASGNERWRRPLGPFTNFHGMGASPIVAGGKVVLICDQDQGAFLLAVDKDTGKTVWKAERPDMVHSFSTPVIYTSPAGPSEVIVPGSYQMTSYNLATGELIWRVRGLTYQVKSGPVLDDDRLYFNGWAPGGEPSERMELPGFDEMIAKHDTNGDGKLSKGEVPKDWHPGTWDMQDLNHDGQLDAKDWEYYRFRRTSSNSAIAIKLGGRGDVTASHVLWRYDKSLPDVPGILLYRGVLYLVRNGGILQTLDPATGKLVKQGRLMHALDEYYASPVAGDGKVYLISRHGAASVLDARADWNIASTSDFGEEVFATPAIADGHIWVRTATALYDFAANNSR